MERSTNRHGFNVISEVVGEWKKRKEMWEWRGRTGGAVRLYVFFFSLSFFFVTIVTLELLNEILCSFSALFFIGFSISSIFFSSLILYMVM